MYFYLEIRRSFHLLFCSFHRRSGWGRDGVERNGTQFSVLYNLSFAAFDLKCETLKEIEESCCIYPHSIIRYHCDSFTSEARMIAAKACSAAWFNTHAIIGASQLDGGRVFLSQRCHLTCCLSDHTRLDIIKSSLLKEYLLVRVA